MLLLWEANIDVQFIHESSMVLDRYITAYITKAEKNSTAALWEDCNKNRTLKGNSFFIEFESLIYYNQLI